MKLGLILRAALAAFILATLPLPSFANIFIGVTVGSPPPAFPVYVQPFAPAPNFIWTPGYWAWGPYGYYWVPGTWVLAPEPGLLWTPGYWAWARPGYRWYPGYWARRVGYYGGINYGFGYFGVGYVGGAWFGNVFRYNTYVTRVDTTIVRNVYVDRTVYVNRTVNRVSYNGGAGGVQARPTAEELAAARERHVAMTSVQRQHVRVASRDRNLLDSVNHGAPLHGAVDRPFSRTNRPEQFAPVTPQDRVRRAPGTAHAQAERMPHGQPHRGTRYAQREQRPREHRNAKPRPHATPRPPRGTMR